MGRWVMFFSPRHFLDGGFVFPSPSVSFKMRFKSLLQVSRVHWDFTVIDFHLHINLGRLFLHYPFPFKNRLSLHLVSMAKIMWLQRSDPTNFAEVIFPYFFNFVFVKRIFLPYLSSPLLLVYRNSTNVYHYPVSDHAVVLLFTLTVFQSYIFFWVNNHM